MNATTQLLATQPAFAASFEAAEIPAPLIMKVAVVTCMDARPSTPLALSGSVRATLT